MKIVGRAVMLAALIGTVLQIGMVTAGHNNIALKSYFAVGGMGLSLVAGILYTVLSGEVSTRDNLTGGAIAGGICAFIGIAVSWMLKDVPGSLLLLGTVSSVLTGAIGGWLGRLFSSARV